MKAMKYYTIYKTSNNINGKIYIGQHITENLNDGYLGSGKNLREDIKKYGMKNFTKEILHIFDNFADMDNKEKELVDVEFILREDTYNIRTGGQEKFNTIDRVTVKDTDGSTMSVSKDDPRYLSGELVGIAKGLVSVKDEDGNNKLVSVNDPEYINGELVSSNKNYGTYLNEDGVVVQMLTDEAQKLNLCGSTKNYGVFFNKIKNIYESISITDEIDYNIYEPMFKNKIVVKDKDGNILHVATDDPRYLSGELRHHIKNRKYVRNIKTKEHKAVCKSEIQQYLDAGWEYGRYFKTCKNKIYVSNNEISKCINSSELDEYLANGWTKGRLKRVKN